MCNRLYSISIPKSVTKMGDFLYNGRSIPFHIFIPMGTRRKFERLLPMHKDLLIEKHYTKILSTIITSEDVDEYEHLVGITDEYGALYSLDGLRLLKVDNESISSYQIRQGTKVICDRAFSSCKSLHSVVIPSSIINIGINPFANTNVTKILCNSVYFVVENHALLYNYNNEKKVLISYLGNDVDYAVPNSVETVNDSAFEGNKTLESISLPANLKKIGPYAFARCFSLKTVNLPISLTGIADYLFEECYSLQSIIIPEKVFSIGTGSFSWCESLETTTIPERSPNSRTPIFKLNISELPLNRKETGNTLETRGLTYSHTFYTIPKNAHLDCKGTKLFPHIQRVRLLFAFLYINTA